MAAISSSSSPPPPAASFRSFPRRHYHLLLPRPLQFSKSNRSISNNHSSSSNGNTNKNKKKKPSPGEEESIFHLAPPPSASSVKNFAPVFVTLPADAVDARTGRMSRPRATTASFMALASAGVEGVAIELWWGLVERDAPLVYDWAAYLELIGLAWRFRLKVRAIMAFHQCGSGPGDPLWLVMGVVLLMMDEDGMNFCDGLVIL